MLAAYDFPPIPSPQSLRWAYLVREMSRLGHEIHILAPDVPGYGPGGLPEIPDSVAIHRVYPGPFSAFLRSRARKSIASGMIADVVSVANVTQASECSASPDLQPISGHDKVVERRDAGHAFHELNWKGRLRHRASSFFARQSKPALVERCKNFLSYFIFPDYRAEWLPWAHRRLEDILVELRPDIVITSHEPACSLPLGVRAKQLGYRWVADLGDPVLAPYTPPRWKKRAHALERAVCMGADLITVTSRAAADTLHARHGLPLDRCMLVTQGFDASFEMPRKAVDSGSSCFDPDRLELLYTGSFYDFRKIGHLLQAVTDSANVRLNVATIAAPAELLRVVELHPESFRLLGFLSHQEALVMQRGCDVLVNLANANPVQVPGKLYEYLGAGVPILHIGGKPGDAASDLLTASGVGVCERDDYVAIRKRLQEWRAEKYGNGHVLFNSNTNYDLSMHSWRALAERFVEMTTRLGQA